MILISHRGNLEKKDIYRENTPQAIMECLRLDLHVEIDIWNLNNRFYLGHDSPIIEVPVILLEHPRIWCHAKNDTAFFKLKENNNIHCFWHNTDDYTITSKGYICAYPGKNINEHTIAVLPEQYNYSQNDLNKCLGICSDNILGYINAKNN